MPIIVLVLLGLCAGSFINALVWRVHAQSKSRKKKKNLSVLNGRSMCTHCRHELSALDLIPVFSWIWLRGKCRYCHQPISIQYPVVELAMMLVFVISYLFWPADFADHGQVLLFSIWLLSSVGMIALLVYDFKWMLLPNRIVYPTLAIAVLGRLGYDAFYSADKTHSFWLWALSLAVSSGIFWLLFEVSKGRWIGFGDVRLGLITGTLLADPKLAFLMIFLASLLGLAAMLSGLLGGKISARRKIAFGPFLIIATWLCILFGQSLIDWYERLLT